MKKSKRIITAVLSAVMLLSASCILTGCGKKSTSGQPEYVYVPKYITIKGDSGDGFSHLCYSNGKFYYTSSSSGSGISAKEEAVKASYAGGSTSSVVTDTVASGTDISGTDTYTTSIYSLDIEGNSKKLDVYKASKLPAGREGSVNLQYFDVDAAGNIYVVEEVYSYHFDLPAGWKGTDDEKWSHQVDDGDVSTLTKYDPSGKALYSVNLSTLGGEGTYVSGMKCDDKGNAYVTCDKKSFVLDDKGATMYSYESDGWYGGLVKLPDGRLACMVYADNGSSLMAFDNSAKTATKLCAIPSSASGLFTGNSDYGAMYTNGAYLFGLNTTSGETATVLNWISCDIDNNNIGGMAILEDGRIACVTNSYNEKTQSNESELALLTKTKASSIDNKKVVTMAVQYLDYNIKGQIINFNKTNPDYRIEVQDYSQYNTEKDYTAGLKKMNTEILSGNVPDIIYTDGLNTKQYIAKGLLTDLTPYMDKDSEVKKDKIMDNVLNAMTVDGKIYSTCSSFSVVTVMGAQSVVGTKMGWTVDDLNKALAKMPKDCSVFGIGTTRDSVLTSCLAMDMNDYVDWSTGQCHFDKGGFAKLLEFAKTFPATFDWENYDYSSQPSTQTLIASRKQMLMMGGIGDFNNYQFNAAMFGGKMTCIGFPTENGVGNMLQLNSGFAISSKCSEKDGAWQFVRQFMTEKYQESYANYGFPSNKAAFDKMLKEAMTPSYQKDANGKFVLDKNGNKIEEAKGGMGDESGNTINIYAMKQAEADALMEVINSATKVMNADESINKIITDETAAFYTGAKSADETAKLVQSRVSIYVNEQS